MGLSHADLLREFPYLKEEDILACLAYAAVREGKVEITPKPLSILVRTIVRRIFEQYPDPADLPPRDYYVHDRRAARVAILRKLRTVRR